MIPYDVTADDAGDRLADFERELLVLPAAKSYLLPAFHLAQECLDWLPRESIVVISSHLHIPLSEVYATATAYSELRLEKPQYGSWYMCTGVACEAAGAQRMIDAADIPTEKLGRTDCQFLCSLAPVCTDHHGKIFGRLTADRVKAFFVEEVGD